MKEFQGTTYHDNPNLLNELLLKDWIAKLEPLFALGWYLREGDGKMVSRPGFVGIDHNTNWIHVNPDLDRPCRWYQLIHAHCDFIPKKCLSCWKVVVRPRTLRELLMLRKLEEDLARENPKCWCKCGWEEREWVDGHYGGYFYCNSEEVGQERKRTVRDAVSDYIHPGVDVFLKRYCTEFELKWGDSARYERSEESLVMETAIIESSDVQKFDSKQPQWLKDHIMAKWIIRANGTPDSTAKFYNNGNPLYTPVRRY